MRKQSYVSKPRKAGMLGDWWYSLAGRIMIGFYFLWENQLRKTKEKRKYNTYWNPRRQIPALLNWWFAFNQNKDKSEGKKEVRTCNWCMWDSCSPTKEKKRLKICYHFFSKQQAYSWSSFEIAKILCFLKWKLLDSFSYWLNWKLSKLLRIRDLRKRAIPLSEGDFPAQRS